MGFEGIALCTSIVAFINLGILVFILDQRYGGFIKMFLNRHVLKIIIAGAVQFIVAQFIYWFVTERVLKQPFPAEELVPSLIALLAAIILSVGIYIVLLVIMRAGELRMIKEYLFKRGEK